MDDRDALELLPELTEAGDVAAFIDELKSGAREIRAGIYRCTDRSDKAVQEIESFSAQVESLDFLPDDLRELASYDWPGNVRELEHVVERSVILSDGSTISFSGLETSFSKRVVDKDN